ncbi:histone acetyltransferase subunit NuA4-domain-containing protein [Mycotypha africana]|uniref:histone acetyltransferase subunit NuA4-domain-containing protein n=1 Tax=Mycotypha africana TaxID=64632 RepID=UPI002301D24E|nr:histone acetyltransferase subunit NuA4-domain-containing protein [Mycotypha africana]KAI8977496.1 histone acetyltransferase subunit NuA4-domain-containing protein [Mycotypha africana]
MAPQYRHQPQRQQHRQRLPTSSVPTEPPQVTRQKYEEAKRELQALLTRKKQVDTNLVNLENAIYLFEGSYLEDTQQNGNIIRGFDGYLSNRMDRRKPKFTELDRLFSLSSSTYQKALAQKEEKEQDSSQEDSSSVSARKEKKRKLKGQDSTSLKKKKASAGKDTEDELDV